MIARTYTTAVSRTYRLPVSAQPSSVPSRRVFAFANDEDKKKVSLMNTMEEDGMGDPEMLKALRDAAAAEKKASKRPSLPFMGTQGTMEEDGMTDPEMVKKASMQNPIFIKDDTMGGPPPPEEMGTMEEDGMVNPEMIKAMQDKEVKKSATNLIGTMEEDGMVDPAIMKQLLEAQKKNQK